MKLYNLKYGPVIKGGTFNDVTIWGLPKIKKNCYNFLIVKLQQGDNIIIKKVIVNDSDYNTGIIKFTELSNKQVTYQAASLCIKKKSTMYNEELLLWDNITSYTFDLNIDDFSFIFGSCRRYISIGKIKLFGTGENGDKIFEAIQKQNPKLFLSIGDQVYFDPVGNLTRITKLKDMRKLYCKVRNFENIKNLMATVPTYEICDDHDCHRNDTNWFMQHDENIIACNARKAYYEFQHFDRTSPNLWYTFDKQVKDKTVSFFVLDTRAERNESLLDSNIKKIISDEQFAAVEAWLSIDHAIKFLVSPTPIVSQNSIDSWFGYPEQQKRLLLALQNVPNIFLLVGDAHCARIGTYQVCLTDKSTFSVTEILSSGLVAVNHDIGKDYAVYVERPKEYRYNFNKFINDYDNNNDFPFILDNSIHQGLKLITTLSTKSYPSPNKPTGFNKVKNLYKRVIDNVFTKITYDGSSLIVDIYNQDNILLHEEQLFLQ